MEQAFSFKEKSFATVFDFPRLHEKLKFSV